MDSDAVRQVWFQLVVRHYLACQRGDEKYRQRIFDLIDALVEEFPEAPQVEVKLVYKD